MDKIQIFGERKVDAEAPLLFRFRGPLPSEKMVPGKGASVFEEAVPASAQDERLGAGIPRERAAACYLLAKAWTGWYFYRVSTGRPSARSVLGASAEASWLPYSE